MNLENSFFSHNQRWMKFSIIYSQTKIKAHLNLTIKNEKRFSMNQALWKESTR